MTKATVQAWTRLDPKLRKASREAAKAGSLSPAEYIERLIREDVGRNGKRAPQSPGSSAGGRTPRP